MQLPPQSRIIFKNCKSVMLPPYWNLSMASRPFGIHSSSRPSAFSASLQTPALLPGWGPQALRPSTPVAASIWFACSWLFPPLPILLHQVSAHRPFSVTVGYVTAPWSLPWSTCYNWQSSIRWLICFFVPWGNKCHEGRHLVNSYPLRPEHQAWWSVNTLRMKIRGRSAS